MLALDTDVLVHWTNADAAHHEDVKSLLEREVQGGGGLAVTPQICWEFLHVSTDPRRLESPLSMSQAVERVRAWWHAPETVRLNPTEGSVPRALELLRTYGLGRKRILDTVLAATLEAAGVRRLATFNGSDFQAFPFIEVVDPR